MQRIQLFGADAKVGVTMVAQCLAEALAQRYPEKTIGIYHLDGNPGMSYTQAMHSGGGLDDLRSAIMSRVLTTEELLATCHCIENRYELAGLGEFSRRRFFTQEEAEYLLSREAFDVLIIDCGSNFEMPLALGALQTGEHNVLITTQQRTAHERYQAVKKQILDILHISFSLGVLNKGISNLQLPESEQLKRSYQVSEMITLPYSEYGWQCEEDRTSLLCFKETSYLKGMEQLTHWVAMACQLPVEELQKQQKKSWIPFFLKGGSHAGI